MGAEVLDRERGHGMFSKLTLMSACSSPREFAVCSQALPLGEAVSGAQAPAAV